MDENKNTEEGVLDTPCPSGSESDIEAPPESESKVPEEDTHCVRGPLPNLPKDPKDLTDADRAQIMNALNETYQFFHEIVPQNPAITAHSISIFSIYLLVVRNTDPDREFNFRHSGLPRLSRARFGALMTIGCTPRQYCQWDHDSDFRNKTQADFVLLCKHFREQFPEFYASEHVIQLMDAIKKESADPKGAPHLKLDLDYRYSDNHPESVPEEWIRPKHHTRLVKKKPGKPVN